jgi:hypothetical protein
MRPPAAAKFRTLAGAGWYRQALVAEAVASLFFARIELLIRPFHRVSPRFGMFVRPDDARVTQRAATFAERCHAREIGWAIRATAPFMPFRSVCLQQAMAGHAMLRRRGVRSVMHLGAGKGATRAIDAHAWLETGGVKITGYPVPATFTELGCFV